MSHYQESQKTVSEKITLVKVQSVLRVHKFEQDGDNWIKEVSYFVRFVKSGTDFLDSNEYSYDIKNKTLTLYGGANPNTRDISLVLEHYYSTSTYNLPFDLNNGEVVPFEGRVFSIGQIGQKLDDENTGIVLESSSSVQLINSDGHFDDIFDTHIFENQNIYFYSWYPTIPISEAELLFEGYIENKSYSLDKITFKVKDYVYKLKDQLKLGVFDESSGIVTPSLIGKPKRRIYGRADNVECVCLDSTLEGYDLTGQLTFTSDSLEVTGTGTLFLDEIVQGDKIVITDNDTDYDFSVSEITSNTTLVLGSASKVSLFNTNAKLSPKTPWRKKGRTWSIAGHRLSEKTTNILLVKGSNTFTVADITDFAAGDLITVNGVYANIRRVSGNKIITNINIIPTPEPYQLIVKKPVTKVQLNTDRLAITRDYQVINSPDEALIVLDELAEFNIATQVKLNNNLVFNSTSRNVTTTATVDLRSILKPRDFIRSSNPSRPEWYEISEVYEQKIVLITKPNFSATEQAYYKSIEACNEESLLTVSCFGMGLGNDWIKTASDVVKDLLVNDAKINLINHESFTEAKAKCDYIISCVIPKTLGNSAPVIRDVITEINESVLASLYKTKKGLTYSVQNAQKPQEINVIRSDDLLNFDVDTSQQIVNRVILHYSQHTDVYTREQAFKIIEYQNEFVDKYIGIENTLEKTILLYEPEKVLIMAQRLALFNSLSKSIIKLSGKNNFAHVELGEKYYLDLNRIYKRFSSNEKKKIGVVIGVSRTGTNTEITISDLGNIFNRVPSIAPNYIINYETSSELDRARWGYIVDTNTKTPAESEDGLGAFILG